MKIQLDKWNVVDLNFSFIKHNESDGESFDLNVGSFFPEDNKKSFGVGFKIKIKKKIKNEIFNLNLEAIFMFNLEDDITEDFKLSDFPKINAPAIAFPYLRAYISNLTLQSGFDPIMLPSINFVNLAKEKT